MSIGRVRVFVVALTASLVVFSGTYAQDELATARTAYLEGRYDDAIDGLTRLARRQPAASDVGRALVRALAEVGRYDEANNAAERFIAANPDSPELWTSFGRVLLLQGARAKARDAFARAVAGRASDALTGKLELGLLLYHSGDVAAAMRTFDSFIDTYNQSRSLSSGDLTAVATAVRYLGIANSDLFHDALRTYDEAIAADPDNVEARLLVGNLFLDKYNGSDAREAYDAILERNGDHPDALLGLARVRRFGGSPEAMTLVNRSLETNPNSTQARVFRATLLVELEDFDRATQDIDHALGIDPTDLDALAVRAAVQFLRNERPAFDRTTTHVLELNPRFGGLFVTLAEVSARNRLYQEAVGFGTRAVQVDSLSWRGYAVLGTNQLRVGNMGAGRANLEIAFQGDPFDAWTKNTLDLLDELDRFTTVPTERFHIVSDRNESDALSLYMTELAEEAYARLANRYGFRPHTPIRVEAFTRHADFSVRTIGLVGLGALGVSFGPVVAMDSPSARDIGSFNWGSTLWHELAHTFHLGLSEHRVPRWLSEGLAVFEERQARDGWGDALDPGFLLAFRDGRLLPVSELNNGFVRPTFPEQLGYSYYQASLVCEFIERDHGFTAFPRMLRAYRDGKSARQVFRDVLSTDLDEFDEAFEDYLRARFERTLAVLKPVETPGHGGEHSRDAILARARQDPDDFLALVAAGQLLIEEQRFDEAEPVLVRAKSLFPEYAGVSSPYWYLARLFRERGELDRAARELDDLTARNASHYRALLALATIRDTLGATADAADALERSIYVYPFDADVHRRLAELSAELGTWSRAVRERRAVLALDPVDRAEAQYQLARAYMGAGDRENARHTVLRALEIAPGFEAAQDLLLEIHDARSNR
ncbi:MAG: tetratricopeptide repeat protein [Gemmatimonadota bacterium]|nr:tetratricopeptide repeat protein [Gemmatimonadota bacterium]